MPTKKGRGAKAPTESDSLGQSMALAEMKIETLRAIGVETAPLESLLAKAKSAYAAKNVESGRRRLDEVHVFFTIASEELNAIVERFFSDDGRKKKAPAKGGDRPGSLTEIEETVGEAFLKALHSKGLRRMVEVIALDKVRAVLQEDVPNTWLVDAVRKALSEIRDTKGSRVKKAR